MDEMKIKVKICGVRTVEVAKFCEENRVDFVGLNFVPVSKRKIGEEMANEISKYLGNTKKVGVFQNQSIEEVNKFAKFVDYLQLCGDESIEYIKKCKKPVIKTIAVKSQEDLVLADEYRPYVEYIFFDGATPGSGKGFDHDLLEDVDYPFFLCGGINPDNLSLALEVSPFGIDMASGIETDGKVDIEKIKSILEQVK